MEQRRLTRLLDGAARQISDVEVPQKGWIAAMRGALGMSAELVAKRKGVSRNAIYQAERSEKEGAVSLKQMEQLAAAMGGKFVYAIVPNERIDEMKYRQAKLKAIQLLRENDAAINWSPDDQQDWVDDKAAELLHDMPGCFWEDAN